MKQYLEVGRRIVTDGVWIENERTNKRCLTVIGATLTYDVANNVFPLVTTRKSYWKAAIAELLGYLRGYDSAADFRALGTKSWDANANLNEAWLKNPNRKGDDDLGRVYGVQGRHWRKPDGTEHDQLMKIYTHLKNGIDDRGEILTFWNPGEFELGCLRPCMHTHTFSLVNGTLHMTSMQRSSDWLIGSNWNMVQCFVLLALMAQITNNKPGEAVHHNVNAHIYEDQLELFKTQLEREPYPAPRFIIDPNIKTLEDVLTWVTPDHFDVIGYMHHAPISYPFSV